LNCHGFQAVNAHGKKAKAEAKAKQIHEQKNWLPIQKN